MNSPRNSQPTTTIVRRTNLFFLLGLALTVMSANEATAQLSPFPTWATKRHWDLTAQDKLDRTSSAWSTVAITCAARITYWSQEVRIGPYIFRAQSTSGTIAVWKWVSQQLVQLGGIDTAFDEVIGIAPVTGGSSLPWHSTCVAWVGRNANGSCGAQVLPFDGAQDPSESLVTTLPITSAPGEFWSAVGVAGAYLYVFDANSATILRFQDTDNDALADTRDPDFNVIVPIPERGIYYFAPDDVLVVRTIIDTYHPRPPKGVRNESGVFVFGPRALPPQLHPPVLHTSVYAGMTRVGLALQKGDQGKIQFSTAETGPWSDISGSVSSQSSYDWILVPLTSALGASGYVRALDTASGDASNVVKIVNDKRPVILRVSPILPLHGIQKAAPLTIEGAMLDGPVGVEFVPSLHPENAKALKILSQTADLIQVMTPDMTGSGMIILTKSGDGGGTRAFQILLM